MKKKIVVLVCILMLLNIFAINSFAATLSFNDTPDYKGIEIINPEQDVIYSDYLLISLKIKEKCKFNFSIYGNIKEEEKAKIEVFQVVSDSSIQLNEAKKDANSGILSEKSDYICIYEPVTMSNSEKIKFHSIQLEKLSPGDYFIAIEILDENDKVLDTAKKEFSIKDKSLRPEIKVDEGTKNSPLKSLSDIIKNLFKN
ncbi:MAG: hypothetical protein WC996_00555 [Peptostreptococcales bacterium]